MSSEALAPEASPNKGVKRFRVSEKKAQSALDTIVGVMKNEEFRNSLQQLNEQIRENPELLDVAKAAMRAHMKSKKGGQETCLRRGVARLQNVPDYIVRQALTNATGVEESVWRNMPVQDAKSLFIYAMNATGDYRLPRLKMEFDEFFQWVNARYEASGELLKDIDFDDAPEWETQVGVFKLGFNETGLAASITERSTGVVIPMPSHIHMTEADIGIAWSLQDNHDRLLSTLKNENTGQTQLLMKLFDVPALVGQAAKLSGKRAKKAAAGREVNPPTTPIGSRVEGGASASCSGPRVANSGAEQQEAGKAAEGSVAVVPAAEEPKEPVEEESGAPVVELGPPKP